MPSAIAKVSASKRRKAPAGFRANAAADPSDSPVNVNEQPLAIGQNGGPPLQASDEGDILFHVPPITRFMRLLLNDPSFSNSKTYNWLSRGYIPGRKLGAMWSASKSAIRQRLQQPTNVGGADE